VYPYGIRRVKYPSEAPWEYSNPINWAKHAWWHEAEGKKPKPVGGAYKDFYTVTQTILRRDIVEKLCKELRSTGFQSSRIRKIGREGIGCKIERIEEQICFLTRTKPHYLSKETLDWAEAYLIYLKAPRKVGRPRIPFTCPP